MAKQGDELASNCVGLSSLLISAMAGRPVQRCASSDLPAWAARSHQRRQGSARLLPAFSSCDGCPRPRWRPRSPAGRRYRTGSADIPSCTACSTTSRVVPATGVTMARSKPASRLSSVDLPAFGLPTMAQSTFAQDGIRLIIMDQTVQLSSFTPLSTRCRWSPSSSGTSSSGKSTHAAR